MDLGRIGYRWAFKRGKSDQSYHRPRITVVTHADGTRKVGIWYVKGLFYFFIYFLFFSCAVGCVDPIDCIFVLVIIAKF